MPLGPSPAPNYSKYLPEPDEEADQSVETDDGADEVVYQERSAQVHGRERVHDPPGTQHHQQIECYHWSAVAGHEVVQHCRTVHAVRL